MTKQAKNLKLIQKHLLKILIIINIVFAAICVGLQHYEWIASAILGCFFSALVGDHLIKTQISILQEEQYKIFFPRMLMRFGLYGVPIGLGFYLNDYLNLFIILISLFTFQFLLVGFELRQNYKHFRKRQR